MLGLLNLQFQDLIPFAHWLQHHVSTGRLMVSIHRSIDLTVSQSIDGSINQEVGWLVD